MPSLMTPHFVAFSNLAPQEWGMLAVAFVAVAFGCYTLGGRRSRTPEPVTVASIPAPAANAPRAEAEVVAFLALLQEKGRLIDFLMDDVTAYSDDQVGAAARVVHQGCQSVLKENVTIQPIASEDEGAPIELASGYPANDYRLLGNVSDEPPYQGTVVHKGWCVTNLNLPRTVKAETTGSLPHIAAAQIELS